MSLFHKKIKGVSQQRIYRFIKSHYMGFFLMMSLIICITGVSSGECTKLLRKMFLSLSYIWQSSVLNINLQKFNVPCTCNTEIEKKLLKKKKKNFRRKKKYRKAKAIEDNIYKGLNLDLAANYMHCILFACLKIIFIFVNHFAKKSNITIILSTCATCMTPQLLEAGDPKGN